MKKKIRFLGSLLLIVFILAGCASPQTKTTNSKKNTNEGNIAIKNNSFSGEVLTDDNGKQKMTVHFDNKNHAVVTFSGISKSDNTWSRRILSGRYATNEKTLGVTQEKGMELGYGSKKALLDNNTPTKMVNSKGKGSTLELKVHKKYLVFNEKYKIYPTKSTIISNYDTYISRVQKQYNKKYAKLSSRSFMSPATDMMANGIAFKGDNFIWKYGGPSEYSNSLDIGGSIAIITGQYKLDGQKLTLFVGDSTPLYRGTIGTLGKNYYQDLIENDLLPKEYVFSFTNNNQLQLITKNQYITSENMLDYGTLEGTPNYNDWSNNYSVEKFSLKMQQRDIPKDSEKQDNSSDENKSSSISSADDFKQFLLDQGVLEDDPDNDYQAIDGNGFEFPIYDSSDKVAAKYQVNWDIPDGSISHIVMLGVDGNIYEGNSGTPMHLDEDATNAYNEKN